MPVVPLRWILVRDPEGALDPKAFLCTDVDLTPVEILTSFVRRWQVDLTPVEILTSFVRRWQVEVTFAEVRRHLGVESQRQWSDLAIARTTPCLLGLFSLVTLSADRLHEQGELHTRQAAWYDKADPTFSDCIAMVRGHLWRRQTISTSPSAVEIGKIPRPALERLTQTLAYAA